MHNDHKFNYVDGIAHRKHIVIDRIRHIGKESNNLDETSIIGINDGSYLEYENLKEFKQWLLTLKPKDVKDKGISDRGLRSFKQKIRSERGLKTRSKIAKTLFEGYRSKN